MQFESGFRFRFQNAIQNAIQIQFQNTLKNGRTLRLSEFRLPTYLKPETCPHSLLKSVFDFNFNFNFKLPVVRVWKCGFGFMGLVSCLLKSHSGVNFWTKKKPRILLRIQGFSKVVCQAAFSFSFFAFVFVAAAAFTAAIVAFISDFTALINAARSSSVKARNVLTARSIFAAGVMD